MPGGKEITMRCERCAGLVVPDHFCGDATFVGGWAYDGWRCVNCGAIGSLGQAEAHRTHTFAGHELQSNKRRARYEHRHEDC